MPHCRGSRSVLRLRVAWLLVLAGATGGFSCTPSPADSWWSHVRWLADDGRQGREAGSPGYYAAAQYVAHEFERAGALPGGTDGYFQNVRFVGHRIVESGSVVELVRGDRADTLVLGEDGSLHTALDRSDSIDAEAVFVGYGLQLPEAGLDDLKGIDLRGKIAVYMRGVPKGIPSTVAAHAQHVGERWKRLRAAGAVGTVAIPNPLLRPMRWERVRLARLEEGFTLADTALNDRRGERFSMLVNPARASRWFEGTGQEISELLRLGKEGAPLPRFPLGKRVRARIRVARRHVESPNVIGVIPGSDPVLRDESIVLTAHLDHLGIGAPIEGDSVYNGALDNASGVATLIEIARSLGRGKTKPARSIVLLALTGEEKGLLGSMAFAADPPPSVGRMAASLNLDMFLPIVPLRSVVAYGVEESELGDWFRASAAAARVAVQPDPHPEQTNFVRSDQYNLVRAGVPSLFVIFGETGDSAVDRRFTLWMKERYHAPSDDVRQPVDRQAATRFNDLLLSFCKNVADRPERARWKARSFFRRYARDRSEIAPEAGGSRADAGAAP